MKRNKKRLMSEQELRDAMLDELLDAMHRFERETGQELPMMLPSDKDEDEGKALWRAFRNV